MIVAVLGFMDFCPPSFQHGVQSYNLDRTCVEVSNKGMESQTQKPFYFYFKRCQTPTPRETQITCLYKLHINN